MIRLAVFWGEQRVGQLFALDHQAVFEYAADYCQKNLPPLSASLPVEPGIIGGARVSSFFGNLLPEGDIRESLVRRYRLDGSDDMGLLGQLGRDCAGALVIVPEGVSPMSEGADFDQRYAPLENAHELGQYLQVIATSPTALFKGVTTRLSLAGAQRKTAVARFDSATCYRCLGGATTHILKLGSRLDHRGREAFPDLVLNEFVCSKLASASGLACTAVELIPTRTFVDGPIEYVFCIERYDRRVDRQNRRVQRLHQEDFCQALGRSRTQKYEDRNNGITLAQMFELASDPDQITVPAIARARLLDLVLFNLIIGNRDSHAKNFSLLREDRKASMAPAYDLVCTQLYTEFDDAFPQRIGDATRLDSLTQGDLNRFAEQIELRPLVLKRQILKVCSALVRAQSVVMAELKAPVLPLEITDVAARIFEAVQVNIDRLAHILK